MLFEDDIQLTADLNISGQVKSTVSGVAPIVATSRILNINLNADLLDDEEGAFYLDARNLTNKYTTLAGWGISDAYTKTESDARYRANTWAPNLDEVLVSGNISGNRIRLENNTEDGTGISVTSTGNYSAFFNAVPEGVSFAFADSSNVVGIIYEGGNYISTNGYIRASLNPIHNDDLTRKLYVDTGLSTKYNTPTGTTTQYIRGDGTLATFPTITGGTVTSVSATGITDLFTASVATATTTPAISFSLSSVPAGNRFFASPNGAAGNPTFRAIVKPDMYPIFGADTITGALDWNDVTNTMPGSGPTLLQGNVTNGPGSSEYYHPFNFNYQTKVGTGNVTQVAFPYNGATQSMWFRSRFSGTWSSWHKNLNSINTVGTLNRISITHNATTSVFDISSTYVGQTSITTLGTISTGTWSATTIAINKGGTGLTSVGSSGQMLRSNGTALEYFTPDYISSTLIGVANGIAPLDSSSKIPAEYLPTTGMQYKGTWNANTNTPTLSDGTGISGNYYRVETAGTVDLGSGPITYSVGDDIIHNGTVWQRAPGGAMATNLALGTITSTTIPITNSNGTGFTLPSATTTLAGLLSAADKVKLNSAITAETDPTVPAHVKSILTGDITNWNTAYSMRHAAVTLSGQSYLSLAGQAITASAVNLSGTHVTGTAPIARGGTGLSSVGTSGQLLRSTGAGLEYWTADYLTSASLSTYYTKTESDGRYVAIGNYGSDVAESTETDANLVVGTNILQNPSWTNSATGNGFLFTVRRGTGGYQTFINHTIDDGFYWRGRGASTYRTWMRVASTTWVVANTRPNTWVPTWTDITGKPSTFAPAPHTLDSHSNVTVTSPVTNQYIGWSGTQWVNMTLPAGVTYTGSTSITLSGNSFQRAALTGDVTSAANSNALTIANSAVTLVKMANLPANTIIGNNTGSATTPIALTAAQARVLLNVANGATANQTDAYLLNRTNHTGNQAISTVTGLQTALDGKEPLVSLSMSRIMGRYSAGSGTWEQLTLSPNFTISGTGEIGITGLGTGTVTQVISGTGLTGGPITTTGTLSFDTTFGDARYATKTGYNYINGGWNYFRPTADFTIPAGTSGFLMSGANPAFRGYLNGDLTFSLRALQFEGIQLVLLGGGVSAPAAAYSSGGYGYLVRNNTSGNFETRGIGITDIDGLQTALDGKYTTPSGTVSQYVRGDGSLAIFPTIGNGTITFSPGPGISVGGSFSANQSTNTTIAIALDATLSDIDNVTITGASTGQLFRFDGTNWTNWTPNYLTSFAETDPTVPAHVKLITISNISDWNSKQSAISIASSRLMGRYSAGSGPFQEITLGSGITLSGTGVLSAISSGGTVTSVGLSAPTGFTVSGSPITGSGTISLTYTSGYTGYTTTEQTKLSGIAAGATANQTDAYLLNRTNHTGTQAIGTITGLQSALDGKFPNPTGTTVQYIRGDGTLANFPTIPIVNNGTLTMSVSAGLTGSSTFTANQAGNSTFTVGVNNSYFDGRYVSLSGSSMTGPLIMSGAGIQITPNSSGKTFLYMINPNGTGTGYPDSYIVQSSNNTVQWYSTDGVTAGNLDLGFANVTVNGLPIATQSWVGSQGYITSASLPTNYVTTNTAQSGLTGSKSWIANHTWNPTGDNNSTNDAIMFGFSPGNGPYIMMRNSTSQVFVLRSYMTAGIQMTMTGGISAAAAVYSTGGYGYMVRNSTTGAFETRSIGIGDITGLQTALNSKFNTPTGTTSQYIRGDGSLATFPAVSGGTVTQITAGTGLTGGVITTNGTLAFDTSFGDARYATKTGYNYINGGWNYFRPTADYTVPEGTSGILISGASPVLRGYNAGVVSFAIRTFNFSGAQLVLVDGGVSAPAATYSSGGYGYLVRNSTSGNFETRSISISDISNLQTSLDAKYNTPTGTTAQYVRGDGSLATFPAVPSNYVTTNTTQTGLGGLKYWTESHSWVPVSTPTMIPSSIQYGANSSGHYIVGRDAAAGNSFVIRSYESGGIQLSLSVGGVSTGSHGTSANWYAGYNYSLMGHITQADGDARYSRLGHTLGSHGDITITSPGALHILQFDHINSRWVNRTPGQAELVWSGRQLSFQTSTPGALSITGTPSSNLSVDRNVNYSIIFGTGSGQVAEGNHTHSGYVPIGRTITINGVTQDLSSNRSWTVGGGISGGGISGRIAKWSSSSSVNSSNIYEESDGRIGIGAANPSFEVLYVFGHIGVTNNVNMNTSRSQFLKSNRGMFGSMDDSNHSSVALQINSTSQGFLLPRMTTTQWNAISSKATGLMAWNSDENAFMWWDGTRTAIWRFNGIKYQGWTGSAWVDFH